MARPQLDVIDSTLESWDAKVTGNFEALTAAPLPIAEHSGSPGDESDLEATWPAAQHDRCVIAVNHSVHGWSLAISDGATWKFIVPV